MDEALARDRYIFLATQRDPSVEDPKEEDLYSYEARYEIGRTEFICPAELSDGEREAMAATTRDTWEALRYEGFARVDLILGANGPEVLEVNAVPGLTDTSLLPMSAEAAGMSFEDMVARVVDLALARSPA